MLASPAQTGAEQQRLQIIGMTQAPHHIEQAEASRSPPPPTPPTPPTPPSKSRTLNKSRPPRSPRRPSLLSRFVRWLILSLYKLQGWKVQGSLPDLRHFVIAGAPHSSNWDFVFFIGATDAMGVKPCFMGKHTLFKWPMTHFMLDMGGIPIDRRAAANAVEQVAAQFASRDELALVIAAEGTRSSKGEWKSGFYHIATAANVPIVPAWADNKRRRVGFGAPIMPSGDYGADLSKIAAFMRIGMPDNPRLKVLQAQAAKLLQDEAD